jgi:ornithine carbamoyltransferase
MPERSGGRRRNFLTLLDLDADELVALLDRARAFKQLRKSGAPHRTLEGKVLGMVFEKASTRTRVSFEVGMFELGGHAVFLASQGSQLARGEPIEDTARVLGGYCHAIVIRTFEQKIAERMADWSPVPVINGLTDKFHPCQLVADLMTVAELRTDVRALRYAWIGDGNNMAHSWMNAAALLGLDLVLACPHGFDPDAGVLADTRQRIAALGRGSIEVVREPVQAARGADVISTDVWASMGQEGEAEARRRAFAAYCVDEPLIAHAVPDVIVLHCLPAHRGEEISDGLIEGSHSAVWRQSENRLHAQKALLELFLR